MIRRGTGIFVLVTGIAVGFTVGVGVSSTHQSASARGTGTATQTLEGAIKRNATDIANLKRQVRLLSGKTAKLGGQVRGNRRATSTIATKSGIRIEFRDDPN